VNDGDLEGIFAEDGPRLWRSLYAYTGGRREIADDALAEAFARALAHADVIREPLAWLYRVAYRIAGDEMKKQAKHSPLNEGPEAQTATAEGSIMPALRRLSPAQRAAVYLHYQADLPVREIATRLGMSAAAVKVHLSRGRGRLRTILGEDDDD
jgi:RNA polymerase sigma-70 factor (ECF subfamily)